MSGRDSERGDRWIATWLGLGSLALYLRTAAPTVATLFDDSLEFQVVLPTLGISHPSGYPLYTLLGKLMVAIIPWRDPAGRTNLLSAMAAAAAVALFYLVTRRFVGQRWAGLVVSVALAISPVWWSQSTLAEVYALHGLFVVLFLYALLRWEHSVVASDAWRDADRWLIVAALVAGLGMTHHRMIALLLPAAFIFILWSDPSLVRRPRRWIRPLLAGVAPLLLYLYLPWRGQATSSLDGTYVPSLAGTMDWVLARGYNVFLTGNPFHVTRGASDFVSLFSDQFGPLLLIVALCGLGLGAWRFQPRRLTLLLVATITQIAFGVAYKVEDIGVFFIPAFFFAGIWIAIGAAQLHDQAQLVFAWLGRSAGLPARRSRQLQALLTLAVATILLWSPVSAAVEHFPDQDRSDEWALYDQGQAMVESVAEGGRVVGLGGEITLLRYFRDVLHVRPDLQLTRADDESVRMGAVLGALTAGEPIYLTRDLPGAASAFSLDAEGSLIRVSPRAAIGPAPAGAEIGAGIRLVDARSTPIENHSGSGLRLTFTWATDRPIAEDLKFSVRLLDDRGEVLAVEDHAPVYFAYPTTAWVVGEPVTDVCILQVLDAEQLSRAQVWVILYRSLDGAEIGRLQVSSSN